MANDSFSPDLHALVAAAPFPVYGLDSPQVRLHTLHYSVDNEAQHLNGLTLVWQVVRTPAKDASPTGRKQSRQSRNWIGVEHILMPEDYPYADLAAASEWAYASLVGLRATLEALADHTSHSASDLPENLVWKPYPRNHFHSPWSTIEIARAPTDRTWLARRFQGPFTLLAVGTGAARPSILSTLVALKTAPDVLDKLSQDL